MRYLKTYERLIGHSKDTKERLYKDLIKDYDGKDFFFVFKYLYDKMSLEDLDIELDKGECELVDAFISVNNHYEISCVIILPGEMPGNHEIISIDKIKFWHNEKAQRFVNDLKERLKYFKDKGINIEIKTDDNYGYITCDLFDVGFQELFLENFPEKIEMIKPLLFSHLKKKYKDYFDASNLGLL